MDLGERAWQEVSRWDCFAKDTVGKQWVRAIDSIAANLSEGFGRFHYRENQQFGYYARGSLSESKTWLTKAAKRHLISQETYTEIANGLDQLGRRLNAYIKSIGAGSSSLHEDPAPYGSEQPMTNDD